MASDPPSRMGATRRTGTELFRDGTQPLPFDPLSFW